MTVEQRKSELIDWISSLDNESYLQRLEELKQDSQADLPDEIIDLIEQSAKTPKEQLIRHTSVKDFYKDK